MRITGLSVAPSVQRDRVGAVAWAMPGLVALLVFWPMLVPGTQFYVDWVNGYWLVLAAQGQSFPIWFFGATENFPVAEPWFLYYGGYWFSLIGWISELTTTPPLAVYRISYAGLALVSGYSILYLARRASLGRWPAATLGSLAVCSPYFLTNAFGRGAYAEYVFTALLPLFVALISLIWAATPRKLLMSAAAGIGALLLTTHMASLSMSANFLVGVSLGLSILLVAPLNWRTAKAWCRCNQGLVPKLLVSALVVSASLMIAAPQLLPALLTAPGTLMGIQDPHPIASELSSFREVFSLWPHTHPTSTTPDLRAQTLTWIMLWCVFAMVVGWRQLKSVARWVLVALTAVLLYSCLITSAPSFWMLLPDRLVAFQFPYRFVTYVTYCILMLALVLLSPKSYEVQTDRIRVTQLSTFAVAACLTFIGALWQTNAANTYPTQSNLNLISAGSIPPTWYAPLGSFRQIGSLVANTATSSVRMQDSGSAVLQVICTGEEANAINVAAAPPLIRVAGASSLGTTSAGLLVIDMRDCRQGETIEVRIERNSLIDLVHSMYPEQLGKGIAVG